MLDTKTTFYNGKRMGLDQVREIEKHVASCIYLHPPLKALVFKEGPVKDTTPLLLACHYGELDAVKHLVERWGVNVPNAALYYNHVEYNLLIKLLIDKGTPLIAAAFEGHPTSSVIWSEKEPTSAPRHLFNEVLMVSPLFMESS